MELNPEAMPLSEIIHLTKKKIIESGDFGHPANAEVERLEATLFCLEHMFNNVPAYIGNQS